MIKNTLQLDIIETACDTVLKILDSSIYAEGMPYDCPRIDITVPGFIQPIYITDLVKGFSLVLNGSDLGLQEELAETPYSLPDGIYTIKYSVAPNDKSYVVYYHLRTTYLLNKYYEELCKVQLQKCEPTAEVEQKLEDLRYIKSLIDASKAKVEYCHAVDQGVDMYSYASKQLDKYKTGYCIRCRRR